MSDQAIIALVFGVGGALAGFVILMAKIRRPKQSNSKEDQIYVMLNRVLDVLQQQGKDVQKQYEDMETTNDYIEKSIIDNETNHTKKHNEVILDLHDVKLDISHYKGRLEILEKTMVDLKDAMHQLQISIEVFKQRFDAMDAKITQFINNNKGV